MGAVVVFIDHLAQLYETEGQATYLGESISIADHMLQCAHLAEQSGEGDEVIASALLHDIGHLLLQRDSVKALESSDRTTRTSGRIFCKPVFLNQ